ncbi:MAG: TadA family conjugal transfer-associated ATPase [Propionibacteriales bacterium]|nr:TadA family conjugal transfer-associated ATPase [Propionibacteriales bacterium]
MNPAAEKTLLVDTVRTQLALEGAEPTPARVAEALRSKGRVLGDAAVLDVVDALRRDALGAGPLEPLLREPGVTDVVVNGPEAVYVDRGSGLEPVPLRFPDDGAVRRLAQRLAAAGGRRLDDATPYVDTRLPDGCRFHAVLSPIAQPGTCLSLRVPARRAFACAELVEAGTFPAEGLQLLRAMVSARAAFVVTGATGSGKTTVLSSLLSLVPEEDRMVLVEDTAELAPQHPHVVSLEARPPNVEGAGEITLRHLVRQALRMRPDRLVVGEVRGAEVVDLLAALNTGHRGGCGTVHANSAGDVPARLEALAVAAGLSREAAHSQIGAALQAVVHMVRDPDGRRRVAQVATLERDGGGRVEAVVAVTFGRDDSVRTGPGGRRLERILHPGPG